ncbi:MAG: hypothetical protein AAF772_04380 [Acidobacteriota bacterium]
MNEEATDNLEIEPLSDDDLESVAGGAGCKKKSCSGRDCSVGGDDDTDVDADVNVQTLA